MEDLRWLHHALRMHPSDLSAPQEITNRFANDVWIRVVSDLQGYWSVMINLQGSWILRLSQSQDAGTSQFAFIRVMIIPSQKKLANSRHRHFNFQLDKVNYAKVHHIEVTSGSCRCESHLSTISFWSLVSMLNLRVFFRLWRSHPRGQILKNESRA